MLGVGNVLVIAPHPDDEVLGCGGTIKKLASEGAKVYILIMTRGKKGKYSDSQIENVRNEAVTAHKLLGITRTRFLDYPAPDLDLIAKADISASIKEIIEELRISTLFLPHRGDIHNDHKVIFDAGLVASRPVQGCPVTRIFSYETLSETEWAAPFSSDAFIPTYFVNISGFLEIKLNAMKCFKSQLREFPNSRSLQSIESLAKLRGCTVGYDLAEAFMTIRIIEY